MLIDTIRLFLIIVSHPMYKLITIEQVHCRKKEFVIEIKHDDTGIGN